MGLVDYWCGLATIVRDNPVAAEALQHIARLYAIE